MIVDRCKVNSPLDFVHFASNVAEICVEQVSDVFSL
jgi:hypothetical protein